MKIESMEVWRHDYTGDTGDTAVEITINGVEKRILFTEFNEATELVDTLVTLFDLRRSSDVWYMFSHNGP